MYSDRSWLCAGYKRNKKNLQKNFSRANHKCTSVHQQSTLLVPRVFYVLYCMPSTFSTLHWIQVTMPTSYIVLLSMFPIFLQMNLLHPLSKGSCDKTLPYGRIFYCPQNMAPIRFMSPGQETCPTFFFTYVNKWYEMKVEEGVKRTVFRVHTGVWSSLVVCLCERGCGNRKCIMEGAEGHSYTKCPKGAIMPLCQVLLGLPRCYHLSQ